jgi:hypothetical protein
VLLRSSDDVEDTRLVDRIASAMSKSRAMSADVTIIRAGFLA